MCIKTISNIYSNKTSIFNVCTIKAACLQMNQNISRKSNLIKKYGDFKKSKGIQDKSNNFYGMCNL
jgi:capsular polysaccharide biosynthesis protein